MNVLDENILGGQRRRLRSWRIPVRKIGIEVGHRGMADEEIIPLLHQLRKPTFFTRDLDFYKRLHCHRDYCPVYLAVGEREVASFIRRFLRHPGFNTQAKRMGAVVRISHRGMHWWLLSGEREEELRWSNPTP